MFARRTKTDIKHMSKTNVGANLVFARRTTIVCEPMSEANVSNSFSNIGLISVFGRRANIRFAPTLVLLICLILVFGRRANTRFAPTLVSEIGWISITTIYPKIYDRLLIMLQVTLKALQFLQRAMLHT